MYLSQVKRIKLLNGKRHEHIDFHLGNGAGIYWVKCLNNGVGQGFIFHKIIPTRCTFW